MRNTRGGLVGAPECVDDGDRMQRDLTAALSGPRPVTGAPGCRRVPRARPRAAAARPPGGGRRGRRRAISTAIGASRGRHRHRRDPAYRTAARRSSTPRSRASHPAGPSSSSTIGRPARSRTGPVAEDQLWPRLVAAQPAPWDLRRVVLGERHLFVERAAGSQAAVGAHGLGAARARTPSGRGRPAPDRGHR